MLCETWLNDDNKDLCSLDGYALLKNIGETLKGCGAALYVKITSSLK